MTRGERGYQLRLVSVVLCALVWAAPGCAGDDTRCGAECALVPDAPSTRAGEPQSFGDGDGVAAAPPMTASPAGPMTAPKPGPSVPPDKTPPASAGPHDAGPVGDGAADAGEPVDGSDPGRGELPSFILGADISSVHEREATFIDTDGQTKSVFALLQNHGFNFIRVKTFVDPSAPHGYASSAGGCVGLPEAFSDRDHVVAFGREIKAAGMGFLLDFHYSDVWADPGKQHIPAAWRDAASIEALAARLGAYTRDVVATAVAAGARPDMVQIGNEITPGMLMHVPGPNTDCWGNMPLPAPINGSTANWDNLARLLEAGIEAVREVDPRIRIMLHIENTDDQAGALWWVDNAVRRGLDFDVLGLSCYTAFQGEPSVWEATFRALAAAQPTLSFAIAEYNPERTRANRIMRDLPDGRGLGTFLWEPTRSGAWGEALFDEQGDTLVAKPDAFAEFDQLRAQLGL